MLNLMDLALVVISLLKDMLGCGLCPNHLAHRRQTLAQYVKLFAELHKVDHADVISFVCAIQGEQDRAIANRHSGAGYLEAQRMHLLGLIAIFL